MIQKRTVKMVLDIVMTIGLLFLMAVQVTGDEYHEWLGAGMLLLFCIHNVLNLSWYRAILKGKYTAQRGFRAVITILVLIAILVTGYSGIVMSRYAFDFLPINHGMATARTMHLAGSYWAFVLMSIHIGIHGNMMVGMLKKKNITQEGQNKDSLSVNACVLRIVAFIIAACGAVLFGKAEIFSNMFLQNEFAILDYDTSGILILLQNLAMMFTWIYVGHYVNQGIAKNAHAGKKEKIISMILAVIMVACCVGSTPKAQVDDSWQGTQTQHNTVQNVDAKGFILIEGGTFEMGSPESENWRSEDETLHAVMVSDFYMSPYELTQTEYESVMGNNPSTFSGEDLPVENISWIEAVNYCNVRSEQEGLTPAYLIEDDGVSWNRGADGYRLPTEAEWEYACRAGTETPFNTETSISAEEANYYGHYPYDIEENYFEQGNLTTQPGQYRETTVAVDSFSANAWGLYNMHGNVSEWVWDYYGEYDIDNQNNPTGADTGELKVYRGGGWNDFAKNIRSAYRATLEEDMGSFNIGIRLVRNAQSGAEDIVGNAMSEDQTERTNAENADSGKVLIAFFSWGGNTKGVAEEIQRQTGADLFEITLTNPYSSSYNTVLDEAQRDQNIQARPELATHVEDMEQYDTILIGYPNWWASIPMPIASFLEEYDFVGKTIVPFCSHGGGRFGQSLTAIAKLAPDATMGEGLSIHYSGGNSLEEDVRAWLQENGIKEAE